MNKFFIFLKNYYFPIILIFLFLFIKIDFPQYFNQQIDKSFAIQGEHICVSLSQLLNQINDNNNRIDSVTIDSIMSDSVKPEPIIEMADSLFGISWIEGYLIDSENKDVILVGKRMPTRPAYRAEDIIVNLRNVFDSLKSPYCSLDPKPENIKKMQAIDKSNLGFEESVVATKNAIGGQMVVVGGVPKNSHHAKVMIYADYDMKKLSQGLLKADGIPSTIEISILNSKQDSNSDSFILKTWFRIKNFFQRLFNYTGTQSKSSMSRFWFHIKKNDVTVYPNFVESDNILFIRECPVVVLTEKQVTDKEGNLSDDSNEEDDVAEKFATNFSNNYSKLATIKPIFAELENMFRLQALFRALKYNDAINKSGLSLTSALKGNYAAGEYLPESLPGLVNHKIIQTKSNDGYIYSQLYLVSGGVSMESEITGTNFFIQKSLMTVKQQIFRTRTNIKSTSWIINL